MKDKITDEDVQGLRCIMAHVKEGSFHIQWEDIEHYLRDCEKPHLIMTAMKMYNEAKKDNDKA